MTATSHALTGALIATVIRQPILAIPLSFLSHFVCDSLPHLGINMKFGDKAMVRWLVIDGSFAALFALSLILLGVNNPVLLATCGFAAMSPDLFWLYHGLKGRKPESYGRFTKFHAAIQKYESVPGVAVDIIWSVGAFLLILRFQ